MLVGKHPLYKTNDDIHKYAAKLRNVTWNFPSEFSELAKEFFLKLMKVNPLERYTAKEALAHPWITRVVSTIPLSYAESVRQGKLKTGLLNVKAIVNDRFLQFVFSLQQFVTILWISHMKVRLIKYPKRYLDGTKKRRRPL